MCPTSSTFTTYSNSTLNSTLPKNDPETASMKSLKMVKMKVEEEDYLIRTEMKEETQALFKKLGIKAPKRITKM